MADEAVEIGNLFAEVHSPDNFLGDVAVILAEAGRREEALDRISKNLERFHDDAWVILKCHDIGYQGLRSICAMTWVTQHSIYVTSAGRS
jgi:hypothetical protein